MKIVKFKLKDEDKPFLKLLQLQSPSQLDVLIAFHTEPPTSYETVATELAIPVNTVKTRLYRARQKILGWRKGVEEQLNATQGTVSDEAEPSC